MPTSQRHNRGDNHGTIAAIGLIGALTLVPALGAGAADGSWDPAVTISDSTEPAERPQLVTDGTTITVAWTGLVGSDWRI